MPRIGRLLLLGVAMPMMLFSHPSFGRGAKKACVAALSEGQQTAEESSSRLNKSSTRFSYDNAQWLSKILREQFIPAPAPQNRGVDNVTDANLRRWTDDSGLMVIIIDPNVHAHRYMRDSNHIAKPSYLKKCRSITDGPEHARGLVACPRTFFSNEQEWQNTKDELAAKGLFVDEENHSLVYYMDYSKNKIGEKRYFYSDIDLFAVFKMSPAGARPYFRNRLINQINRAIGLSHEQGVQHGPREAYHGKAELGFKFPVTAYVPGIAEPLHIRDVCELKRLYQIVNLDLEDIWRDYFKRQGAQFCEGK